MRPSRLHCNLYSSCGGCVCYKATGESKQQGMVPGSGGVLRPPCALAFEPRCAATFLVSPPQTATAMAFGSTV